MTDFKAPRVVVIGAGISGLSAAFRLQQLTNVHNGAVDLVVLESKNRVGGLIESSAITGGFLIEHGPESINLKLEMQCLLKELALESRLISSGDESRRTLVARGRTLHPLPEGFVLFAPTRMTPLALSKLFSWTGKLRMALDLVLPAHQNSSDESLADFVRRRLGNEALERLAEPLLGGIHGASPEVLSAQSAVPQLHELEREFGSLIRGLWYNSRLQRSQPQAKPAARFASFDGGLQVLTQALSQRIGPGSIRLGVTAIRVEFGLQSRWRTICSDGSTIDSDAVILALPAKQAADLVSGVDDRLSGLLADVTYNNTLVVNVAFRKGDITQTLAASGFVVPALQGGLLKACTFSSVKFSHRAPEDAILLRLYARTSMEIPDDTISEILLSELKQYFTICADPIFAKVTRHTNALPLYAVGHQERMLQLQKRCFGIPSFALAGNAYHGIGLADCVSNANLAALAVHQSLLKLRTSA